MTDNVTITQGANSTPPNGTVIATDDVGGVQYQVVKLDQGANGLSSPVTDIATDGKLDDIITELSDKATDTKLDDIITGLSGLATDTKIDDVITQLTYINSLVPAVYDYISLSYTGSNLTTVVYKTGGSGGSTVRTLTLGYDGSDNLIKVTAV